MIRGLIFDFDGLDGRYRDFRARLVGGDLSGVWLRLPSRRWAKVLGGSGRDFDACGYLAKQTGLQLDPEELRARRWRRKLELVAEQPLMPGIAGYLAEAKRSDLTARRRVKLLARMGRRPPGPAGRHGSLRRHRDGGRRGSCEADPELYLLRWRGLAGGARGYRLRGRAQRRPCRQTRQHLHRRRPQRADL